LPAGTKLRNRLTLWSFILLTLFLGVGGFFCYLAQQQELLKHLDKQLLSIARNFSCGYHEVAGKGHNQADFCKDFNRLSIHLAGQQAVILYALDGQILCDNQHPLASYLLLTNEAKANSASGRAFYETIGEESTQQVRRLTVPIINTDQVIYHLQLGQSLADLKTELNRYTLYLVAFGVLIMMLLTLCQWLLLGIVLSPLKALAIHMDNTHEDNLEQKFLLPLISGTELNHLAGSYNQLTERMANLLQRTRQFATDVTHELRTPLTILRGETELALRGSKSAEELQEILNSNLEEISRMGHLVDDLLLLSKSELGEIPLKLEALNLNEILEELYFHGTIIAEPKQIKVALQAPDQQISIYADANRIRQVFLNLLTNGIKYTPEGGTVTINWSLQGDMARIIFEDTGIGIDSEHQQHIFDRFYRINKTGNRNDGGSGLGLAIAKWLVEAHGGSIMVCSVPGKGSTFAIMLPLTHKPDSAK
jgi:signal transduction histidine kinase